MPVVRPDAYLFVLSRVSVEMRGGTDHTGGYTDAQCQDRLNRHVHRRDVERLEKDLCRLLPIRIRVQRRFCQQDGVLHGRAGGVSGGLICSLAETGQRFVGAYLLGQGSELFGIDVGPYPLHVVPICDNPVLHRVAVAARGRVGVRTRRSLRCPASRRSTSRQSARSTRAETHLIRKSPRSSCAFLPTNVSPSTAPAITRVCFGRPVRTQDPALSALPGRVSYGQKRR